MINIKTRYILIPLLLVILLFILKIFYLLISIKVDDLDPHIKNIIDYSNNHTLNIEYITDTGIKYFDKEYISYESVYCDEFCKNNIDYLKSRSKDSGRREIIKCSNENGKLDCGIYDL